MSQGWHNLMIAAYHDALDCSFAVSGKSSLSVGLPPVCAGMDWQGSSIDQTFGIGSSNPSDRSINFDRSVVGISPLAALPYNSQQYQSATTLVGASQTVGC